MLAKTTLIGRVGQEPQMRYTPDGTPVANFSVATTKKISKDKTPTMPQGWKDSFNSKNWEITTWYRVTVWRKLAEVVNQYVTKGMQVYVEGEMTGDAEEGTQNPRVWAGNDGVSRASFELTAFNVKFLGSSGGGEQTSQEPPPDSSGTETDPLPF